MSKIVIAVLQRGWVVVGVMSDIEGDTYTLTNAAVIRCWGTTKGLGEIATQGPTNTTILDPVGCVRFHQLTAIMLIDCEATKWQSHL